PPLPQERCSTTFETGFVGVTVSGSLVVEPQLAFVALTRYVPGATSQPHPPRASLVSGLAGVAGERRGSPAGIPLPFAAGGGTVAPARAAPPALSSTTVPLGSAKSTAVSCCGIASMQPIVRSSRSVAGWPALRAEMSIT